MRPPGPVPVPQGATQVRCAACDAQAPRRHV
ncbi:hypothetical protein ABZ517_36565 [Streptomyces scabiei]